MCYNYLVNFFFEILGFYALLLIFFTITRKQVTYRGLFYSFSFFLCIFVIFLMSLFNPVVLGGAVSEVFLNLNSVKWVTLDVSISLRLDTLSYLFVLLVSVIGFGTNLYTLNYLKYEAQEDVFTILINWFMFSMIILVLANNLFTLFLGWESIGLSSFFLINFWSTRRGTVKSSFKAFFFNKISDVFLFMFLVLIHYHLYTNNINLVNIQFSIIGFPITGTSEFFAVCLFMCTLFKSAQFIGHLWLPDSMEAPVPASALIHSATLVSAGIYLLLRFTPIIILNNLHIAAILIGALTAAYGGVVSASQTDMKKLLAYSTVSHCGFLFVTIGTEIYAASIIYLFLHGLFKALTFFCAGSFIRVAGSQDTRHMGALSRILPTDTVFLLICIFNLGGLPFSMGYLYKNTLMAAVINTNMSVLVVGLCVIGLLTSLVYSYRLVYYSAFDLPKEYFLSLVYELQQKKNNIVKFWSLTSIVQIAAVTLLFLFSIWIYLFFINYFVNAHLVLDQYPLLFESTKYLSENSNFLFKSFYEVFYSLYLLIFFILTTVGWRVEYTYIYRINFLVFLTSTIMFSIITSIIFNL